jgi:hypothetical protein
VPPPRKSRARVADQFNKRKHETKRSDGTSAISKHRDPSQKLPRDGWMHSATRCWTPHSAIFARFWYASVKELDSMRRTAFRKVTVRTRANATQVTFCMAELNLVISSVEIGLNTVSRFAFIFFGFLGVTIRIVKL